MQNPTIRFWARIQFLDQPRSLGWKPDFVYPDDPVKGWAVWPIAQSDGLWGIAFNDDASWGSVHADKIELGAPFILREGYKPVAEGVVARLHKKD